MKLGQKLWTRDELILAINLYCKLPFGKLHSRNKEIITLASIIGRTPSSVALKLGNFASLDPSLQARGIKGAANTSKLDKELWNEFYTQWDTLPYESEKLLAQIRNTTLEEEYKIENEDLPKEGEDRERVIKARVNQAFFRNMVLSAYNDTCCITGLTQRELLIAGHIKPWSLDKENRLNPRNGIAINALHDKAFENGLITITKDYTIKVSPIILKQENDEVKSFFSRYAGKKIILPSKFLPDESLLEFHNTHRFKKS